MAEQRSSSVGEVLRVLQARAPHDRAEDWDNVGLLLGDPETQTSGAVVSIDLTAEAVEEAKRQGFRLIVTHHPCIFPPSRSRGGGISKVLAGTPIYQAIRDGISVACFHSNFDVCALEVVDRVSKSLGIRAQGRFFEEVSEGEAPQDARNRMSGLTQGLGYGFWGEFPAPKPFSELTDNVKKLFGVNGVWITNPPPERVSRVGFVAGKGASFLEAAAATECDLFITGEVGYHNVLSSLKKGLAVMEIGHRESELFFLETMEIWLSDLGLRGRRIATPVQTLG